MAASYSPALHCSTIGETQLEVKILPQVVTRIMGVDPLIGMDTGSMPMTGGHGTVAGFVSVLEGMGLKGAGTVGMAAATFGLIAGSMLGGPLAERIIRSRVSHVQEQVQDETIDPAMAGIESDEASPEGRTKRISTNEQEFQQYAMGTPYPCTPANSHPRIAGTHDGIVCLLGSIPPVRPRLRCAVLADLINTAVITLFLNLI